MSPKTKTSDPKMIPVIQVTLKSNNDVKSLINKFLFSYDPDNMLKENGRIQSFILTIEKSIANICKEAVKEYEDQFQLKSFIFVGKAGQFIEER